MGQDRRSGTESMKKGIAGIVHALFSILSFSGIYVYLEYECEVWLPYICVGVG